MLEFTLQLPKPIYYQVKAAAERDNKPIHDFLVEVISQRFASSPQAMEVKNESESSYYQFVNEWVLL